MIGMTYNILGEDELRIPDVLAAVAKQSPDFLAIQEANFFTRNNNHYLKEFSEKLNLPYFDISLATEYDYHVASFSRYPFKSVNKLNGFRNAALETVIDCEIGEISVCNTHLTPYTEDQRLEEIKRIIEQQKKSPNGIIFGDLNSLSPHDDYSPKMIMLNDTQRKKFTKDDELQFKVITLLEASGYVDTMFNTGINHKNTVPTPGNTDEAHGIMRLDYIFVSSALSSKVVSVDVLKNDLTDRASDHYPVVAELK